MKKLKKKTKQKSIRKYKLKLELFVQLIKKLEHDSNINLPINEQTISMKHQTNQYFHYHKNELIEGNNLEV